jgi:hypothetical protein
MKRTKLFNRAYKIMFGAGSGGLWVVALAVTAVNLLVSLINPIPGLAGSILTTLVGVATAAFLSGALIHTVSALVEGQPQTIAGGFQAGDRSFLALFLVGLILAVPTWILSELASMGFIASASANPESASPTALVLLCCALPAVLALAALLFFAIDAVRIGAERAVALEGLGVPAAFRRAAGLLRDHLKDFIVIELMMAGVSLVIGIFISCPLTVLTMGSSLAAASESAAGLQAALSPDLSSSLPWLAALLFPLQICFSAVWTLAFRRWQGKDVPGGENKIYPQP